MKRIKRALNRRAGLLLVAGFAGLAWHNWRLWQRDQAQSAGQQAESLPAFTAWPATPRVSILVAAWNEAGNIEAHIRSFLDLSYPNTELILCAGGADDTYDLACRMDGPRVMVLEQKPGEGKQQALQTCLAHAGGSIILLSDADCLFSDTAFLRLIEPIVLGAVEVVTGVSEPRTDQRDNSFVQYQWFGDVAWSSRMPSIVDGVLGRNCALSRDALDAVGGFKAPARTGTDYLLSRLLAEAGYQIAAVPHSRIATEYPASSSAYLRMWRRWNKNLLIHGLRYRARKDVQGVLSACALYGTVFLAPLATPLFGAAAWGTSLLLFSAAVANRVRRLALGARLTGVRVSAKTLLGLPFYTCLDMLAVLLALRDALSPRLRSRW
jgi:cellulose synthase/poly-beta-1,6-N-acetylglucosamine synthase-like glycosyltransferase